MSTTLILNSLYHHIVQSSRRYFYHVYIFDGCLACLLNLPLSLSSHLSFFFSLSWIQVCQVCTCHWVMQKSRGNPMLSIFIIIWDRMITAYTRVAEPQSSENSNVSVSICYGNGRLTDTCYILRFYHFCWS